MGFSRRFHTEANNNVSVTKKSLGVFIGCDNIPRDHNSIGVRYKRLNVHCQINLTFYLFY